MRLDRTSLTLEDGRNLLYLTPSSITLRTEAGTSVVTGYEISTTSADKVARISMGTMGLIAALSATHGGADSSHMIATVGSNGSRLQMTSPTRASAVLEASSKPAALRMSAAGHSAGLTMETSPEGSTLTSAPTPMKIR